MTNTHAADIFQNTSQIEAYADIRGRRELEVALSSGTLSEKSEHLIMEWLEEDVRRQQARKNVVLWIAATGAVVLMLAGFATLFA